MTPIVEVEGLQKTYKGGFEALQGVSLAIQEARFWPCLAPMARARPR